MASPEMHNRHCTDSIWFQKGDFTPFYVHLLTSYHYSVNRKLYIKTLSEYFVHMFGDEQDDVVVNTHYLAELQRRVYKAEFGLREKEEEKDILLLRIQQYETRWSEYEYKMKSMEELWQKEMHSLQASLNLAKQTLTIDDNSDATANLTHNKSFDERTSNSVGTSYNDMTAGLSLINRLAEEFEQRSQVFGDDAKFLVEVKSGQAEADLNPEEELRRLKQGYEVWKKDYDARLRETKVILNKLSSEGSGSGGGEKVKKNWWGRLNSSRVN